MYDNKPMPNPGASYRSLMTALQEVEFTCVDLQLYCDTHPDDKDARDKFNHYSRKLRELKTCFDRECGPLQNFGYSTSDKSWVYSTPWPWELQ